MNLTEHHRGPAGHLGIGRCEDLSDDVTLDADQLVTFAKGRKRLGSEAVVARLDVRGPCALAYCLEDIPVGPRNALRRDVAEGTQESVILVELKHGLRVPDRLGLGAEAEEALGLEARELLGHRETENRFSPRPPVVRHAEGMGGVGRGQYEDRMTFRFRHDYSTYGALLMAAQWIQEQRDVGRLEGPERTGLNMTLTINACCAVEGSREQFVRLALKAAKLKAGQLFAIAPSSPVEGAPWLDPKLLKTDLRQFFFRVEEHVDDLLRESSGKKGPKPALHLLTGMNVGDLARDKPELNEGVAALFAFRNALAHGRMIRSVHDLGPIGERSDSNEVAPASETLSAGMTEVVGYLRKSPKMRELEAANVGIPLWGLTPPVNWLFKDEVADHFLEVALDYVGCVKLRIEESGWS